MLYLDEGLVDMGNIGERNYEDHGWDESHAPEKATSEKGESDVKLVVEYLDRVIQATLVE